MKLTMDKEMQQFQDDLMEAVRDMKAGRATRTLIDIAKRNPEVLCQAA